ncbi:MAG: putative toxin-antitoxin system toxin component, PIN family [Oscillospiraceae bacterium]|nr:putative toxin-antitoxin system toxin component, PIN family [Oscillospiraceae bacterium]
MHKVVLDTNILVSAYLKTGSVPWRVLQTALYGAYFPLYNEGIFSEYTTVLQRAKFSFGATELRDVFEGLFQKGIYFNPIASTFRMPDETDRIFYDTAKNCGAYLITGNKKHYPNEAFIVSAAEFITGT